MASMPWNESLSVGVKALDDDHKQLVSMINELVDGIVQNRRQETLTQVLDKLVSYTQVHFAREESFFARTRYAAAAEHTRAHRELVQKVTALQARLREGGSSMLSLDVMKFLKDWLTRHILEEDKKYQRHLNANGIQ
jgi:hemerythrin-like metal-binding protein